MKGVPGGRAGVRSPAAGCSPERERVRKFTSMLEIHGKQECPFAWRARLTAREKGIAFEWIPHDVGSPDPRASQHNPQQRSPLLWDEGFPLVESLVIAQYIDESREGRALLPGRAKERARMRELTATVAAKLEITPSHARDANAARRRIGEGHAMLDAALSDGRAWLGGDAPMLPDLMVWPFLALQERDGAAIPAQLQRACAFWARAKERDSLRETRPRTLA